MKQIDDKIKFEDRSEIRSVLAALQEWQENHEPDEDVQRMIQMLDYMEMCW